MKLIATVILAINLGVWTGLGLKVTRKMGKKTGTVVYLGGCLGITILIKLILLTNF